ncbi:CHAT domain-containing tetratricopeptide repeat protein [Chryseolinea sp. T2]|uniref:CHAT domain-containing tetratricopeptide repeat protein n=1 Tax=Chryseolinea sp. T2 TaxID=3129255 RepID=UPI003076E83E
MKQRLVYVLICVVSFSMCSQAQIFKDLEKAAINKAKSMNTKENRDKLANALVKEMDRARSEFDSTDFDYAILLSDNSGLFDIKEKGEGTARFTSMVDLGSKAYRNESLTDADRARLNREMGEVLYGSQKYAAAEKKFSLAKDAYEKASLQKDVGYLKTLSNQGLLYATMGRYTQAEAFTSSALSLREQTFGKQDIGVAASLNNYGVLRYNLAQFNEAEQDLNSALAILVSKGMQTQMSYAILLNNKAMLFQAIGRYEESERILKQAIAVAEKLQSTKSRNHLKFLSNLALLYTVMKKYPEAEAICLGMENRLGKTNPDYASMLNNLASLYMLMQKEERVESLLKQSGDIYKSNFGENNPAYAKAISDLGNYYVYKNRLTDAAPLVEKALQIREVTLGTNHPHYVQSREDMAILLWKRHAWDDAVVHYKAAMQKSLDFIGSYFPPMSEAEKTKYWDVLSPRFQRFYSFAIDAAKVQPGIVEDIFDYQIATKALLLSSTNKVKESILNSGDKSLVHDYKVWLDQKETLARLYGYTQEDLKLQRINLDSMEQATNSMEKSLSARSADFSSGYSTKRITSKDIKAILAPTEAVVDIVRVQMFGNATTPGVKYLAVILTKEASLPRLTVIENGDQLETRYLKYYRNAVRQRIADDYSHAQYWAPIESQIAGKKVIYISPDGIYNQVNLNTLKKSDAGFVINRFDLVILGNSKDLIALKNRPARTSKKNALLIGFPDYGQGDLAPLPATKVEVETIGKVLKTSGYQVTSYMQKDATEAKLKSVKAPSLMHIATHGYFLQDVDRRESAFGVNVESASENPLLRSGLMLANAAATVSGHRMPNLESNDNGVLTAYEAMNLNLEGTELVVMSACETGLGDIRSGEGVYGLQRAFQVAGADAMIMSMWKVDDAATQMLMTSFYSNWIKLGNKQKAFREAQLQLMTKFKDPYYWGSFVMMGM